MEKLTPNNLSELFPGLLDAASDIWGQEVDNVSWLTSINIMVLLICTVLSLKLSYHYFIALRVFRKKRNPCMHWWNIWCNAWRNLQIVLVTGRSEDLWVLKNSNWTSNTKWSSLLQVKQLGLFYEPYYLEDLFNQSPGDRLYNVKLIERARNKNHRVKHYRVLDEVANSDPKAVVANEQNDFYVVHKDESVIFYSYSDPERCRCY